jgi:NADPH:quinone reductase-like Zn-dependent oxidoreductase
MRAVLCNGFEGIKSLSLGEAAEPRPGADEVLIDVHAASVSYMDYLMICGATRCGRPADADRVRRRRRCVIGHEPAIAEELLNYSIVGVFTGAWMERFPDEAARAAGAVMAWIGEGKLRPRIDRVLPLERAAEAMCSRSSSLKEDPRAASNQSPIEVQETAELSLQSIWNPHCSAGSRCIWSA